MPRVDAGKVCREEVMPPTLATIGGNMSQPYIGARPFVAYWHYVCPAVRRKRTGRVGGSGLAFMYPAFDRSILLRAIMDISALATSSAERPRWAKSAISFRDPPRCESVKRRNLAAHSFPGRRVERSRN
jgi:hypothetical protein